MRVRFEWTADPPLEMPVNYHQLLQGIIYQNLREKYDYSTFLHEEGYSYGRRHFRLFCFSDILSRGHVNNKRISFRGTLSFEVSSPNAFLIHTLAENIGENGIWFGERHFTEVDVWLSDYEVETEMVTVKALSPITVYSSEDSNGKTRYYSPPEDEFIQALNYNFQRKYEAYCGVPVRSSVRIVPINVSEHDKCVTTYKGVYITGYYGIYSMYGERKYLNFLYQAGIGAKNSQGFGMIEEIAD